MPRGPRSRCWPVPSSSPLVRGKLTSRWWRLSLSFTLLVSAAAFLIHEQNPWLFSRAAFLHHAIGWTLLVAAVFPLGQVLQPRRLAWSAGFAMTWVVLAVMLFCDRDVAPDLRPPLGFRRWRRDETPRRGRDCGARAPDGRLRSRDADQQLARDAVAARRIATRRRAPVRPGGDDDRPGDRGVLGGRDADCPASRCRATGGRIVRVPVHGLERGESYTVRWRATSSDGHTGAGVYTFGIGVTPPAPTEAYGSTGTDLDGRRRTLGVLRRTRAARGDDRPSAPRAPRAAAVRASPTGCTGSPPRAASRH